MCFQNIGGIAPIKIAANAGSQLHVMLTVVDTWCDKAGDGAWFGIKVGGKIVTRGLYTVAMASKVQVHVTSVHIQKRFFPFL